MATKKTPQVTVETLKDQNKGPVNASNFTVTDADGRVLEFRALDLLEQLDVMGLMGELAANENILASYIVAASIRKIDGNPRPFPQTKGQLRDAVRTLGTAGLVAIGTHANPQAQDEQASLEDFKADVGNE